MKRIPPEIDRLMWAVAETPSDPSIEEFAQRYPAHHGELMRRVNMVRGLRTEVHTGRKDFTERPRFQPREISSPPPVKGLVLAGFLGIAAVAAAMYTIQSSLHPAAPVPQPVRLVQGINVNPPVLPNRPVYVTPKDNPPQTALPNTQTNPAPDTTPPYYKTREAVRYDDVSLIDALTLITEGTGIHLIIGPGFVDQRISVEYHNKNTVEILKDMAKTYAFTISNEGRGDFLVIPAADDGSATGKVESPHPKIGP